LEKLQSKRKGYKSKYSEGDHEINRTGGESLLLEQMFPTDY